MTGLKTDDHTIFTQNVGTPYHTSPKFEKSILQPVDM